MVHQEKGLQSCCICPECQHTCNVCMGSGTKMEKGGAVPDDILLQYEYNDDNDQIK